MLYLIIRFLTIVLYKVLFRLQAFGRGNIPLKGGVILASNHTSYLDPPALSAACPRVASFLTLKGLFKNALFGRFIRALNAFPIDSQTGDPSGLRRAIRELEEGRALIIFPEGKRTPDAKLDEPRRGVGFLAAKADVPIVPVFIEGSNRALPIDSKFIRPTKIKVYFGRPILPAEVSRQLNGEDFYQAIATKTMEEIARLKKH